MKSILIKNGRVWDGEKFFYADVFAENGIVTKIEKDILCKADFEYDASGKIVSAGFVDAHVHLKGISPDNLGEECDVISFPFGVTAVADASAVQGNSDLLDSLCAKVVVFASVEIKNNRTCFENAEKMLTMYGKDVCGLKVYFDDKMQEVYDIKPLAEVVEFADKNKLKVMVHSSNSPVDMQTVMNVLRRGDIISHIYHGGNNKVSDDKFECMKYAKKHEIITDVAFAGNVHTDFPTFSDALKFGCVPDVISSDITKWSACKRGGNYGLTMCMSMAKILGMSEEDIFSSVTKNPAEALGKDSEWGFLKVGKCADIAVTEYADEGFDLSDKTGKRIFSNCGYRNVLTISNGKIVYKF